MLLSHRRVVLLASTAILLTFGAESPAEKDADKSRVYKILHVADGDTVVLRIGGVVTRVGMLGVETPKTAHTRACQFLRWQHLKGLLAGQSVRLETGSPPRRDRAGRTLAHLYRASDGRWINLDVIASGYGAAASSYPFEALAQFQDAERKASGERIGVWDDDAIQAAALELQKKDEQWQAELGERAARRREILQARRAAAVKAAKSGKKDDKDKCGCKCGGHRDDECRDRECNQCRR